jgi:hypothetical protein
MASAWIERRMTADGKARFLVRFKLATGSPESLPSSAYRT